MKNLFLTLATALFMFSCGTEAKTDGDCAENCKKENCEHGSEKCKKECGDKCDHKKGDKKECGADCKKECCSKDKKDEMMAIGTTNPSLEAKLKDVSGKEMYIEQLGKKNGMLVVFSCNTCPFVVGNGEKSEGWENRYNDIAAMAKKLEIGFALVNSNEGKRDNEDSFEKMVIHAKENNYKDINYLMDVNHMVADAFNARTTPHVYLFNANNELVYTGAIDDNVDKKAEVKEFWLSDAMKSLVAGTEIAKPVTKHMGCSIKRVKKEEKHDHAGHGHGDSH